MTHFDEISCLLFLDGELGSGRSDDFASHVAECAACRALLDALERESRLLGNALLEDDAPLPARLRGLPWLQSSRESAHWSLWAWILSFAVAATACFTAWTDILEPWTNQLDQIGIHGGSLLIRLAVTGAFWEGWTTMLITLQYAVLALVGISIGIGVCVLLSGRWRRSAAITVMIVGLATALGLPAPANAADIRRGNDITVSAGETIQNDLIAAGESVRVDGTVNGDLITFSQNVTVNGRVTGDIIAFGDMIRIDGPVEGNVRCFCNTLTLDGSIGKNLSAFAAHVEFNPQAAVDGGIIAFAKSFIADGKVKRDLLFFVSDTTLDGSVGGDVRLRGGRFAVGPTAQLSGRLQVISDRRPEISESAKLARPLEFQFATARQPRRRFAGLYLIRQIVSYGVAFLCGLLLLKLFPGLFAAAVQATRRVGLAMSVGALVLVAGTALVLVSVLLLLAGAGAGLATLMLYVPVLYGAQLFVGAWIGEAAFTTLAKSAVGQLALGLLVLRILGMIPFLGFFVWTAVFLWGAGAISIALWNRTRLEAPLAIAP